MWYQQIQYVLDEMPSSLSSPSLAGSGNKLDCGKANHKTDPNNHSSFSRNQSPTFHRSLSLPAASIICTVDIRPNPMENHPTHLSGFTEMKPACLTAWKPDCTRMRFAECVKHRVESTWTAWRFKPGEDWVPW